MSALSGTSGSDAHFPMSFTEERKKTGVKRTRGVSKAQAKKVCSTTYKIFADRRYPRINFEETCAPLKDMLFSRIARTKFSKNLPYIIGVVEGKETADCGEKRDFEIHDGYLLYHWLERYQGDTTPAENGLKPEISAFYINYKPEDVDLHPLAPEEVELVVKGNSGEFDDQFRLAQYYKIKAASGLSKEVNEKEYFRYILNCAESTKVTEDQRYSQLCAMLSLAACYLEGIGILPNPKMAILWMEKAAEGGLVEAMTYLADHRRLGSHIPKSDTEAFLWYRKAIDAGNTKPLCYIGQCYLYGIGTEKDAVEAVNWLKRAVEKGDVIAMKCLADCYLTGRGTPQNNEEFFNLMKLAADCYDVQAQCYVGICFQWGHGFEVNPFLACYYLQQGFQSFKDISICYCLKRLAESNPSYFLQGSLQAYNQLYENFLKEVEPSRLATFISFLSSAMLDNQAHSEANRLRQLFRL